LVEDAKESAGKDVRDEQPFHACWKSVPEFKPVALKDVMAEQVIHVELKFVPPAKFNTGNSVSAVQFFHASVKTTASLGSVLNVIPEGKEANEVQLYQLL